MKVKYYQFHVVQPDILSLKKKILEPLICYFKEPWTSDSHAGMAAWILIFFLCIKHQNKIPLTWPCLCRKTEPYALFGSRSMKRSIKMRVIWAASISISKMEREKKNILKGAYLFTQQLIKADKLIKSLLLGLQHHVIRQ